MEFYIIRFTFMVFEFKFFKRIFPFVMNHLMQKNSSPKLVVVFCIKIISQFFNSHASSIVILVFEVLRIFFQFLLFSSISNRSAHKMLDINQKSKTLQTPEKKTIKKWFYLNIKQVTWTFSNSSCLIVCIEKRHFSISSRA